MPAGHYLSGKITMTESRNPRSAQHYPRPAPLQGWVAIDPAVVPPASQKALRDAIALEKQPATDYNDLLWIMAQQSSGVVNAQRPDSTARGLFQLLRAQYGLNPNGEKSFGIAVEEAQGGLRYIYGRYHLAYQARKFWERNRWY
ncbi:hypothetical protein [Burkholderia glumae]|uniref:aggregation-promoting factor C-terminal-like domain-containing protein n=1 Tax=Burkholderia glumae TaxID=337 RepID=UPI002151B234|nr:hypothetical protein [Burkholderia glumae]UVS98960.1 hypothetical protein EFP19_25430 [Burkholderia glumae]